MERSSLWFVHLVFSQMLVGGMWRRYSGILTRLGLESGPVTPPQRSLKSAAPLLPVFDRPPASRLDLQLREHSRTLSVGLSLRLGFQKGLDE